MQNNRNAYVLRRIISYCNDISEAIHRFGDDCAPRRRRDATERSHAAQKMREGPSKPPYRWRLQTTLSCFGQKPR